MFSYMSLVARRIVGIIGMVVSFGLVFAPAVILDFVSDAMQNYESPPQSRLKYVLECSVANIIAAALLILLLSMRLRENERVPSVLWWLGGVLPALAATATTAIRYVECAALNKLASGSSVYPEMLLDELSPTFPLRWISLFLFVMTFLVLAFIPDGLNAKEKSAASKDFRFSKTLVWSFRTIAALVIATSLFSCFSGYQALQSYNLGSDDTPLFAGAAYRTSSWNLVQQLGILILGILSMSVPRVRFFGAQPSSKSAA